MNALLRWIGQLVIVTTLCSGVAAFSDWPRYRQFLSSNGVILLSFVHGADRKAMCRRLRADEIAKLPPNMRKLEDCPRGRPPLYVELDLNDRRFYRATLPPTGIAGDGPSKVYERFSIPAGDYEVAVRMRDTPRSDGFDYEDRQRVSLAPGRLLVIDFRPETKRFVIQ